MIDRENRDKLSHRLRLLAAGRITNDEFEDSLNLCSKDLAILRIYCDGAWNLYSDLWEYKLIGRHKLPADIKRNVARIILFLKSDREFEWIDPSWYIKILMMVLGLLTLGNVPRWYYRHFWAKQGDYQIWPYISRQDLEADLTKHPYLNLKTMHSTRSA